MRNCWAIVLLPTPAAPSSSTLCRGTLSSVSLSGPTSRAPDVGVCRPVSQSYSEWMHEQLLLRNESPQLTTPFAVVTKFLTRSHSSASSGLGLSLDPGRCRLLRVGMLDVRGRMPSTPLCVSASRGRRRRFTDDDRLWGALRQIVTMGGGDSSWLSHESDRQMMLDSSLSGHGLCLASFGLVAHSMSLSSPPSERERRICVHSGTCRHSVLGGLSPGSATEAVFPRDERLGRLPPYVLAELRRRPACAQNNSK